MDRIESVGAPGEGTVVLDEDSGSVVGIEPCEPFDDDVSGLLLVLAEHFVLPHVPGAGDIVMEVVRVGGSDVGDVLPGLCPCGGIGRMGVDYSADVLESLIEDKMCRGVGRGIEIPLHDFTVKVHDHHV